MSQDSISVEHEVVSAEPTKDFFISMLIRDIGLAPAIVDLVDNSVDGARRLRDSAPAGPDSTHEKFRDLSVSIRFDQESFSINDNCGGIPWDIAQNYAFRFGRPAAAPATPNAIGQFGIGMKRALFKLGGAFTVESRTIEGHFRLGVDVAAWRESTDWTFNNVVYTRESAADSDTGTTIEVTDLHETVKQQFAQAQFESELAEELSRIHQASMGDGLVIALNGVPVDVNLLSLLASDELRPAYISRTLYAEDPQPVTVKVYAGIDVSSPSDAGWYLYCNGRQILGPDRTPTTGWGEGNGRKIPQYHNQFARFRGYVFFDSADVGKLPWTTTKEGVDAGHPVYRAIRPEMVELMRPVINFLNALDAEKDHPQQGRESLEAMVARAESSRSDLGDVSESIRFVVPERPRVPKGPETQSIQYARPLSQINAVKRKLRVTSATKVGESTFDYFYSRECADDD